MKSQEEKKIRAQAEQVRAKLQNLTTDLRAVDDEVESLAPQRKQHELLEQACGSLEKLGELGAAALFWGHGIQAEQVSAQLRGVRSRVDAFQAQAGEIDQRREEILGKIGREEGNLQLLGEDLYQVREAEERRKLEWLIERDISRVPHRVQLMAWARGGKDDWRFYRSLASSLMVSLIFGALLPMIDLPLPKRFEPEDMPKRLVQLIRQEQAKFVPPPPVVPAMPPEQPEPELSQQPEIETPPIVVAEAEPSQQPGPLVPEMAAVEPQPQKQVRKAGILAFRDKFASLAKDDVAPRLGSDARYGEADDVSQASSRSMLTTNEPGSSGGINLSSLSRNVGRGDGGGPGGGGGSMQGVEVGRATSSIASIGGGDRPLAGGGGPGATRTDEEIQIVFDRYKASFYRLYNRELRNDSTLRGQMVLRLTIEPDGSVSMCKLQSTDMEAPQLAGQVVNRVLTINFGAKDVRALTIVYPIDFLPAA